MTAIDLVRFSVLQILYWSSGAVFAYPLKKRDNFRLKSIIFLVIILGYSTVFWLFLWDGNHRVEYICRIISALMMVAFLYCGWEAKLSIAIYNSIWAIALWQVLEEIWNMIEHLGNDFFTQYPFMIIVGILILYTVNDIWVAKTIGKWMPVDRGDSIGPRQLGSAILIFGIIEVLAMTPVLRHAAERSFEWRFLYICQFLAIVILYLQNELFKKSSIKSKVESNFTNYSKNKHSKDILINIFCMYKAFN